MSTINRPIRSLFEKFWAVRPVNPPLTSREHALFRAGFMLGASILYRHIWHMGKLDEKAADAAFSLIEREVDTILPHWRLPDAPETPPDETVQ